MSDYTIKISESVWRAPPRTGRPTRRSGRNRTNRTHRIEGNINTGNTGEYMGHRIVERIIEYIG